MLERHPATEVNTTVLRVLAEYPVKGTQLMGITKCSKGTIGIALALTVVGCSADHASSTRQPPTPVHGASGTPGFVYVAVGVNERGCTQYTKRPTKEGIAVDAAIWYRTSDGRYTTDADICEPATNKQLETPQ